MKTLIYILIILFSYSNLFSQEWESTNIVTGSANTRNISFVNSNTGYAAVNSHGTSYKILKSFNKGFSWELIKDFNNGLTLENPQDMFFLNENIGWVTFTEISSPFYKSYIYKTINGGLIGN